MNVKSIARSVAIYLQDNPGTVTLVGGWVVLGAAKLGLHVSLQQLYAIAAVLIPLIAGGHLMARKGRAARHVCTPPASGLGGSAEVK